MMLHSIRDRTGRGGWKKYKENENNYKYLSNYNSTPLWLGLLYYQYLCYLS